jgi:hypothetical protein
MNSYAIPLSGRNRFGLAFFLLYSGLKERDLNMKTSFISVVALVLLVTQGAYGAGAELNGTLLSNGRILMSACHADGSCETVGNLAGYDRKDLNATGPLIKSGVESAAGAILTPVLVFGAGLFGVMCGVAPGSQLLSCPGAVVAAAESGVSGRLAYLDFKKVNLEYGLMEGLKDLKKPGDTIVFKHEKSEQALANDKKISNDILKTFVSDRTSPAESGGYPANEKVASGALSGQ